jgi:hypothetical protein
VILELEQIVERFSGARGSCRAGFALDLKAGRKQRARVRDVFGRNARGDCLTAFETGTWIEAIAVNARAQIDAALGAFARRSDFNALHGAAPRAAEYLPEAGHVRDTGIARQPGIPRFGRFAPAGIRTGTTWPAVVLIPALTIFAVGHPQNVAMERADLKSTV